MFRPEHDSYIQVTARPFQRREQLHAPTARWEGEGRQLYMGRSTFVVITSGFSKVLLSLALLVAVGTACIFAIQKLDLNARADTALAISQAPVTTNDLDQTAEITGLRTKVALLTEQSMEIRSELALLTAQGGVLPQLIARLQEQRQVNAAHAGALRQLYSTTGLIGASLLSADDNAATAEPIGTSPVQVTPVTHAQEEASRHVVLIPQSNEETQQNTGDGNSD